MKRSLSQRLMAISCVFLMITNAGCHEQGVDQERMIPDPAGSIRPKLDEVTLRVGDVNLKPSGPPHSMRQTIKAGNRKILLSKANVTAVRSTDGQKLWSNKSIDGRHLNWLAFNSNIGYLLAYNLNEREEFDGFHDSAKIRRIDLENGQWLDDLRIDPGQGKKVKALLSAKVDHGDLAILVSLALPADAGGRDAPVVGYQVLCFRENDPKPLWTKSLKAGKERGYGGVYVWGIMPPRYAHAENHHLNWADECLIVAAEAMQPIISLNRDSGSTIWDMERIWEFDRGFIGPSVYCHYLSRFGIDKHSKDDKQVATAREEFDRQFSCAIIGGPVIVPLNFERGSDTYSIFVAVSKAPNRQWSGYLSDCVVYELNDKGELVSMVKLPQLVRGERFVVAGGGLVWAGQNESFVKILPSKRLPSVGMGGGGSDLLTRLAWYRQSDAPMPAAWLVAGRAAEPIAFSRSFAFCVPGGGYISNKGDHDYKFPIELLDLSSGALRTGLLTVPFEGTISEPEKNFSRSEEGITTSNPHVLGLTEVRTDGDSLEVTIGMEKWSATYSFEITEIERGQETVGQKFPARDYSKKIASLGTKSLSDELQDAANGRDVEYIRELLRAGADPMAKSKNDWTALMVAACYGTADIVDELIAAGSDINAQDGNCGGQTVLMWAVRSETHSIRKMKSLLKANAAIEAKTFTGKRTALMAAVSEGNLAAVELLLSKGADANIRDKDDHGLVWHSKKHGDQRILELVTKLSLKE